MNLLNNGILQIHPECPIINYPPFLNLENLKNLNSKITAPSFDVTLELIAAYLNNFANQKPSKLQEIIEIKKQEGNIPLLLFEHEVSTIERVNEKLNEILESKENCYYEYIFKLITTLIIALLLTFLVILIIIIKLCYYYRIIRSLSLENTHINLNSLNDEKMEKSMTRTYSTQTAIFIGNETSLD